MDDRSACPNANSVGAGERSGRPRYMRPSNPLQLTAYSVAPWLHMGRFNAVALRRQPPNQPFNRSAQQRALCWVPVALRAPAPG